MNEIDAKYWATIYEITIGLVLLNPDTVIHEWIE